MEDEAHRSPQAGSRLDTKIIHSLDKGLELLELIAADNEGVSLSKLASVLKWDKSTIFRLLTTLARRGYVERDAETKRYRLGFRILHLEQRLFKSLDLQQLSRDVLMRLTIATGEAGHLGTFHKNQVIIIGQCESPERMAVCAHVGSIEPAHATAVGKAILMQLPDAVLRALARNIDLHGYLPNTITTPEGLCEEIQRARALGYAVDDEEFIVGVRCVAVPIAVPGSRELYAIGVSAPASRLLPESFPKVAARVREAADEFQALFQHRHRAETRRPPEEARQPGSERLARPM